MFFFPLYHPAIKGPIQDWPTYNRLNPQKFKFLYLWPDQAEWVAYIIPGWKWVLDMVVKRIYRAFRNWKSCVSTTFHYKVTLKLITWQNNQIQKELHTIGCIQKSIFPTSVYFCLNGSPFWMKHGWSTLPFRSHSWKRSKWGWNVTF